MTILDRLNSGELHAAARVARPDCADASGNVHCSAERARFADWYRAMSRTHGFQVGLWPDDAKAQYRSRYVPSR